jgi:hypothetical protein
MHATPAPVPAHCRNCRAPLAAEPAPRYCWRCGQETTLHEPTFLEFVHEFIGHYVALEGALWRTLGQLIVAPGRLTREYLAGRRRRYVLPLRLYLTASFVFFVVVKVFGGASSFQLVVAPAFDANGRPITAAADPEGYRASIAEAKGCIERPGSCSWFQTLNARIGLKADTVARQPDEISRRVVGLAPYALFLLLPLFAAIVMLAYRGRRMNYGVHFVFGLHTHSFWFLALVPIAVLPRGIGLFAMLLLPAYALVALHRVYEGGWPETLLRGLCVVVLYDAALVVALLALGIASVAIG